MHHRRTLLVWFALLGLQVGCRSISPSTPEAVAASADLLEVAREVELDGIKRSLAKFVLVRGSAEQALTAMSAITTPTAPAEAQKFVEVRTILGRIVQVATPGEDEAQLVDVLQENLEAVEALLRVVLVDVGQAVSRDDLLNRLIAKAKGQKQTESNVQ